MDFCKYIDTCKLVIYDYDYFKLTFQLRACLPVLETSENYSSNSFDNNVMQFTDFFILEMKICAYGKNQN